MHSVQMWAIAEASSFGMLVTPLRSPCSRSPGCTATPATRAGALIWTIWQAPRANMVPRGRRRAKRGGARVADHRRQPGITRLDAAVHVAGGARPGVEQLDHIANRRRVELPQQLQIGGGDGVKPVHGRPRESGNRTAL